jgi:hypothetical protein
MTNVCAALISRSEDASWPINNDLQLHIIALSCLVFSLVVEVLFVPREVF